MQIKINRVRGGEKRGKRAENETDIWKDSEMGKYCKEKEAKRDLQRKKWIKKVTQSDN